MKECTALPAESLLRHVIAGDVETSACALCLCNESLVPSTLPFTLDSTSNVSIAQLVNDLNIFESGDLPSKKVCRRCIKQIKNFNNFRQRCRNNAAALENVVNILEKQMTITSSQFADLLSNDPDKSYTDCTLNIWVDLDAVYANQLECETVHWMSQYPNLPPSPQLPVPQISNRRAHLDLKTICINCDANFQNQLAFKKHVCKLNTSFDVINENLKDKSQEGTSKLKTSKLKKNQSNKVKFQICNENNSSHTETPLPILEKKSPKKEKHVCTYCEDAFASKRKLKLHIVHMHSDQKMSEKSETHSSHVAPLDHTVKTEVPSDSKLLHNIDEDSSEDWFASYFPKERKSLEMKEKKTFKKRKSENFDDLRNESGLFECRKCFFDFETIREWMLHQKDHGRTPYIHCRVCDATFNGFKTLIAHFTSSHPGRPLPISMLKVRASQYEQCTCSHCNKTFRSKRNLLIHMRRQHKEHLKSHVCNICNAKYFHNHKCRFACGECPSFPCVHEKYLLSYMKAETAMPKSKKTCIDCEYEYVRKLDLIDHVNKMHLSLSPHACSECGRMFPSLKAVRSHVTHGHPRKCCPHCNKPLPSSLMKAHISVCKNLEKHFQCGICDQLFAHMESAERHRKTHISSAISCRTCHVKFQSRNLLRDHKTKCKARKAKDASEDKRRPSVVMWPCLKCPMKFATEKESFEHEVCHPLEWEYLCHGCSRKFPTKAERMECMRTHKGNATQVCPICGRLFQKHNLHLHLKRHILRGEIASPPPKAVKRVLPKIHMCDICGSMHSSAMYMRKHKENHKPFEKCEYCLKFIERGSMKKHLDIHNNAPKRPTRKIELKCKECNYTVGTRHGLEGHLNRVHRKIKPNKCKICSKTFYSVANLNSHFYGSHPKKNQQCEVCNLTCRSSKGFKLHMMQHRGQLPHACELCDMKFVCASRKKTHMDVVHLAQQYQCSLCEKVFMRQSTLRMHVLTVHEGGRYKKSGQSKGRRKATKMVLVS